jgi:hypothetical protein
MLLLATAFVLGGCGDLPYEPSEVQEQQLQRSYYSAGNPNRTASPVDDEQARPEPVAGEDALGH